jgi:hypothetical protein
MFWTIYENFRNYWPRRWESSNEIKNKICQDMR